MELLPFLLSAALGAIAAIFAFPALMKYHADRKPRAAKDVVKSMDKLIAVLKEEDEDQAKRRAAELSLQLGKIAEKGAELSKAG